MNFNHTLVIALLLTLVLFAGPAALVRGAGGRIEGQVTDPKGGPIAGAAVTVTNPATKQTFSATTDEQGRYKVEGLAPGTYTVAIKAKDFSEGRRENVAITEGAAVTVDLKLEIATIMEGNVTVPTAGIPNSDPVYQQLRQQARSDQEFAGPFATVTNLTLRRDAATFTLRSGEIYFVAPIQGRETGAVFIGEGEMTLAPPTPNEKRSLAFFTDGDTLTEQFTHLVIRFTDKTFDEIKASTSARMGTAGPQSGKARDLFRDNQQLLRKQLKDNRDLRALADLYAPERAGFFNCFISGKSHSKLIFVFDPLGIPEVSPEEVALLSYGDSDGGIWTAFHFEDEYNQKTASSAEDHRLVDITHHEIDASIKGAHITATDIITARSLAGGTRVVPFDLYRTLRVSRVQDEQGKDLSFIQEDKNEDFQFGIILPQALEAGKTYKWTVQYDGNDALRDSGGGNFILLPRSTWYPNNGGTQFGDRAGFDMTFHYPKGNMLVGTGAPVGAETREGDITVAKWSSGPTELAVAGFNYGRFKKKEAADADTGYNIEFYANVEVPNELKQIQADIERVESASPGNPRNMTGTTLGSVSTTGMANTAITDAENSTRIYNAYFGKLPYSRVAMTQQPAGFFGQAWPTLIFMPYLAFIDSTQRTQLLGTRGGTDNFWRYVAPHEIAHQWWGHIIGWDSYRDQWMSEGFAEFSASLYVQQTRGNEKFAEFWEDHRKQITLASPDTKQRRPYTIGPVTQGYRLSNGKTDGNTGVAYQSLVYPKGAYILHMIRMMMYNQGDAQFKEMMKDFVQTYFNRDISTEDFKHAVEKHMTKEMNLGDDGTMDWFFNEWVYGTEMPSYSFEYQLGGDGSLTGRITQSGVSDKFKMLVPLYVDFGKGFVKLGAARMTGNTTVELKGLKLPPGAKRVAICALNDVLALSMSKQ